MKNNLNKTITYWKNVARPEITFPGFGFQSPAREFIMRERPPELSVSMPVLFLYSRGYRGASAAAKPETRPTHEHTTALLTRIDDNVIVP
jgi:hypothetical protein